ncbi:hypothetical protein GGX14DRAFT_351733 [Mycena pura]|uniref:Uncharacterized protein n=1 Tax=Mycena pura TaxID=153505 RepID=A0AAD7E1A7_9AGAR|nr:hypothetical protein GGX14DRAFT_351733 [Mycena pura]
MLQNDGTSTFEDLIACFDTYTVFQGYYSDETYAAAQPTPEQLHGWEDLVSSLLSVDRNCTSVVVPESIAQIHEVSLFNDSMGPQYCIASEIYSVNGVYAKGWGFLAVPAAQEAIKRNLHFAAPHPAYDLFTPEQAGALFKSTGARSLLIAGRHRMASPAPSDCVVPTSNTTIYYKTDPAHNVAEPFFSASETIREWQRAHGGCPAPSCAFVQMHGKKSTTCPTDTLFLSSGLGRGASSVAWYTGPADRPIKRLTAELASKFPTWKVSLPSDSDCRLTATENVFGRLVNGIAAQSVCTTFASADSATGEFVHIEQAAVARGEEAYHGWTAALLAAFSPAAAYT